VFYQSQRVDGHIITYDSKGFPYVMAVTFCEV